MTTATTTTTAETKTATAKTTKGSTKKAKPAVDVKALLKRRHNAVVSKITALTARITDEGGRIDRGAAEAVLRPVSCKRVSLVTPETGRDGVPLPETTTTDSASVGAGLSRLPQTIDMTIALSGRADALKALDGNRHHLVARILQRVAIAGRPGDTDAITAAYMVAEIEKFLAANPDATEEEIDQQAELIERDLSPIETA